MGALLDHLQGLQEEPSSCCKHPVLPILPLPTGVPSALQDAPGPALLPCSSPWGPAAPQVLPPAPSPHSPPDSWFSFKILILQLLSRASSRAFIPKPRSPPRSLSLCCSPSTPRHCRQKSLLSPPLAPALFCPRPCALSLQ